MKVKQMLTESKLHLFTANCYILLMCIRLWKKNYLGKTLSISIVQYQRSQTNSEKKFMIQISEYLYKK